MMMTYETTLYTIMYFHLKSSDFLVIKEGNEIVEIQTGQIIPETIESSGNDMTIDFQSDDHGVEIGFKIRIEYILAGKK